MPEIIQVLFKSNDLNLIDKNLERKFMKREKGLKIKPSNYL